MELRVLRYFLTVAREGNMAAAARELHLTQSTLSRRIKDLEVELGLRLFDRKGQNMHLTADGQRLCGRAEEIVDMLDKTEAEFAAHGVQMRGDMYLGLRETGAGLLLCTALAGLLAEYPDVRAHLFVAPGQELGERLEKGLLDLALLESPCDAGLFESLPLQEKEVWGVMVRSDHSLAGKECVTVPHLAGKALLLPFSPTGKDWENSALRAWFGQAARDLRVAGSFATLSLAAALAGTGTVAALCPEGVCGNENLCFRPLSPRLETPLCLAWKKNRALSAPCEALLARVRTLCNRRG